MSQYDLRPTSMPVHQRLVPSITMLALIGRSATAALRPESAIGRAPRCARKQPSFKDRPSASHPPLPTICTPDTSQTGHILADRRVSAAQQTFQKVKQSVWLCVPEKSLVVPSRAKKRSARFLTIPSEGTVRLMWQSASGVGSRRP